MPLLPLMKLFTSQHDQQVCRVVFNEILTNSSFKQLLMRSGASEILTSDVQVEGLSIMISLKIMLEILNTPK